MSTATLAPRDDEAPAPARRRRSKRVLTPVLGRPSDSLIADAWLAIRNVLRPSRILRTAYKFVPLGLQREVAVKKLHPSMATQALQAAEGRRLPERCGLPQTF